MNDHTFKIAIDVSDTPFTWDYSVRCIQSIVRFAQEHTRWQLYFNHSDITLSHRFTEFKDLKKLGVDGLFFFGASAEKRRQAKALGIPAIKFIQNVEETHFSSVISDNRAIGELAANYFQEKGYQHFAYSGAKDYWASLRERGFVDTLQKSGLDCRILNYDFDHIPDSSIGMNFFENIKRWVAAIPKPAAILGCNDIRALHIFEACLSLNLHVPDEIAILGVDNSSIICGGSNPPISSIDPNAERIGFEAAAMMDRILRKECPNPSHLLIPPKGVVARRSTDVYAFSDEAVLRAFSYIRDHLAEPIGINDVINASGTTRYFLEKRFFATFRRTIHEDIILRRIEKLKDLLANTSLSLDEIAKLTGFRRANYMTQIFKKHIGQSPGAYRKSHGVK